MRKLKGVNCLNAVSTVVVDKILLAKQELVDGIKKFLENNEGVYSFNKEFNNVDSFKKVFIKDIYIDPINKALYVSLKCGCRLKVVNDRNFKAEGVVLKSIALSTSELLEMISLITKESVARESTIEKIKDVIKEYGIEKEEI